MRINALLVTTVTMISVANCFAQAPAGWTNPPGVDEKMGGEGKNFVNWKSKDIVMVRVIGKQRALKIGDLETVVAAFNSNQMKIKSRVVPSGSRYACMGFIGTTSDNFPAEMYLVITPDHFYSVYATTMTGTELPSNSGFQLSEWLSTISSDEPMTAPERTRYDSALTRLKAKSEPGEPVQTTR